MSAPESAGHDRLDLAQVVRQELEFFFPGEPGAPPADGVAAMVDPLAQPLGALCLSGGGIRSASFALGALQALARFGVLGQFHYLSTVSGGGYIGSWLTAWRHRAKNDRQVFDALNALQRTGAEAAEIHGIRADSNYLTPKLGLLSADTWTVVALYVRNLLLNWAVFGPFFFGLLFIPKLYGALAAVAPEWPLLWIRGLAVATGALLLYGLAASLLGRWRCGSWLSENQFLKSVLAPVIAGATCLTLAVATDRIAEGVPLRFLAPLSAACGAAFYLLAWVAAAVAARIAGRPPTRHPTFSGLLAWLVAGAVTGFAISLGLRLEIWAGLCSRWPLAILGIPWVVLAGLAGELANVALTSFGKDSETDREWLARSAGWFSAVAATSIVLIAVDFYGPVALDAAWQWLLGLGGISGIVALGFGASAKTAATTARDLAKGLSMVQAVSLAALVFAACLAAVLSWLGDRLADALGTHSPLIDVALIAGPILLSLVVSCFVNVNRFSLHAVYRNRLVRAFLGSARGSHRKPDPFTGFDFADNPRMADMATKGTATKGTPAQGRLLHVVNVTLNLLGSPDNAWQERKAEAFAITPFACGNPRVGFRPSRRYGDPRGLSLGTAMAISGAAVSPNQGYHSSPLVSFLLMLFNIRLGWWLGNPAKAKAWHKSGPQPGLGPALKELAGATTDTEDWVYLSDGGHFENLGLYEMVRRRCRVIVVSDAGCDPAYAFEDLGNAVRKLFIDMGVSVTFKALTLSPRQNPPVPGVYCAIGHISYPGSDETGWLIYVKPSYHGTEPAHVRSYALAHPEFPHETTADQWFSESQLEAYRALGAHIFEQICSGGAAIDPGETPAELDLPTLITRAEAYVQSVKKAEGARPAAQ